MKSRRILTLIGLLIVIAGGLAWYLFRQEQEQSVQAALVSAASPSTSAGFARATGPRTFVFPEDHGAHPDYQTEWWYFTGNLASSTGERFGYQLTFFRRALLPPQELPDRESDWATGQVYLAHFALTDVSRQEYQSFERIGRGAAGVSGAESPPFRVWLEDWQVRQVAPDTYRLVASQDGVALDLLLRDTKGPILQGDQGYSQKGPLPGQASYYYSLTRLKTDGTLESAGNSYTVAGDSWMDHEFSTSALSTNQVGWDWFSVQLDDNTELMFFQIRRADGSIDPFSSGALIGEDGTTISLGVEDFSIGVTDTWESPNSGATYPAGWMVTIPAHGISLEITPLLADQEFTGTYSYWEGAVSVNGQSPSGNRSGHGYVEMTGYSRSMGGEF
jgi:predicted secreted hydrolase